MRSSSSSLPIITHPRGSRTKSRKHGENFFLKKLKIVFLLALTLPLLTTLYYWNEVAMETQQMKEFNNGGGGNKYNNGIGGGDNGASTELVNNNNNQEHQLPKWITNYIEWHRNIRAKYPGKALLEDPSAPKVLVRICLGLCGGLHDRLGQLPMDLYLANQTQRILLIKWIKPHPLESFLVPPPTEEGLDWRFPGEVEGWGDTNCNTLNECAKQVRAQPSLPSNVNGKRAEINTSFDTFLSERIHDLNDGIFQDTKAVTFNFIHIYEEKDALDQRLSDLGETDWIYATPSFGLLFHSFFRPHPDVQILIDGVYKDLGLVSGQYDVVHCRVRHPRAYAKGATFQTSDGGEQYIANADKVGLPFEGDLRSAMIETAVHAVQCAATLPNVGTDNPIYFMSDSSDLVHYMTHNLYQSSTNSALLENQESVDAKAASLVSSSTIKLVAREQSIPNAHIDKNKGRQRHEYYGTFVDLYLAMNAKCISYGIGNFATFAARISGTSCIVKHQEEKWGVVTRFDASRMCPLE